MTEIQQAYIEISKDIVDVRDNIKLNLDKYQDYLGWADLDSPIFKNPEILFVGINPGSGKFIHWNRFNWDKNKKCLKDPTKKIIPAESANLWRSHLQWIVDDNAREGKWWDKSKRMKNLFPYTMCELLVRIYRHDYPDMSREKLSDLFEQKVIATNLYPMATQDASKLYRMIKLYDKTNHVIVRKICHTRFHRLLDLTNPHVIVLLGDTVTHELYDELKGQHLVLPISRKRGWHDKGNILNLAEEINNLKTMTI